MKVVIYSPLGILLKEPPLWSGEALGVQFCPWNNDPMPRFVMVLPDGALIVDLYTEAQIRFDGTWAWVEAPKPAPKENSDASKNSIWPDGEAV